MTDSFWCSSQNWYSDSDLTDKTRLPQNRITDVNIKDEEITLDANLDLSCFYEIPHLQCNKLNIIAVSGGLFRCVKLDGSEISISGGLDPKIQIEHWIKNTDCDWSVLSLSTANCSYDHVSIRTKKANSGSMSGVGLLGSNITTTDCYIDSPVAKFYNCTFSNNSKIFCKESGYLENCIIDDTTTLNGIFYIKNGISNASGLGDFTFYGSGINNGKIYGKNIVFKELSNNYGILKGSNILFSGGSINNGNISGNAIFYSALNNNKIYGNSIFLNAGNSGIVSNNALFSSGSVTHGFVSGQSIFSDSVNRGVINIGKFVNSSNFGSVTGDASFYNSDNNGILYGKNNVVFFSGSTNYGSIYNASSISFDMSNNIGYIHSNNEDASIADITFISGSNNYNQISDNYKIMFLDSGINYGTISRSPSVVFNDISINNGIILNGPTGSIVVFNKRSSNSGSIQNNYITVFNNYATNNESGIVYYAIFNNFTHNIGNCEIAKFKNESYNLEQVIYSEFFNNSYNLGICENNELHDNSINYGHSNNTILYDSSVNSEQGQIINGIFIDTSKNFGTITDTAEFNGNSVNSGNISSNCNVSFYQKSKNLTDIPGARLVYFYDSGVNTANLINSQYSGYAQNQGFSTSGYFYDYSVNKNLVYHGEFFNSGINNGSIGISVSFHDRSTNSNSLNGIYVNFYEHSANKSLINECLININDYFINSGNISNTTLLIFKDHSENRGFLSNNKIKFTNYSKNYGTIINDLIIEDIIFSGDILDNTVQNNCSNNGNITNISGSILFTNSINYGYSNAINTIFSNSIHYGRANYAEFYNQSINSGFITSGIFNNSTNYRQIQYGTFVSSYNYGNVTSTSGEVSFREQSSNYGNISCNAIFDGSSCTGISSRIFGTLIGNPNECIQQSGLD